MEIGDEMRVLVTGVGGQLGYDVIKELERIDYGLNKISFKITSWAEVKTLRLIQDQSWSFEGLDLKNTVK